MFAWCEHGGTPFREDGFVLCPPTTRDRKRQATNVAPHRLLPPDTVLVARSPDLRRLLTHAARLLSTHLKPENWICCGTHFMNLEALKPKMTVLHGGSELRSGPA